MPKDRPHVCLQINFAPGDLPFVMQTLPHQMRMFAGQVSEIALTVDTLQSRAFRTSTENYEAKRERLLAYLKTIVAQYSFARIDEVDYSPAVMRDVANHFLGVEEPPKKACDGSAFYAYLYGFYRCNSDFVFHIDSDMLFGGGSQQWIAEAIKLLASEPHMLTCFPLPGPPRLDGSAGTRRLTSLWQDVELTRSCNASSLQRGAFVYNEVSTRTLFFDRRRFTSGEIRIPLVQPKIRRRLRTFYMNTSPYLLLEDCLTVELNRAGLQSAGFLGSGTGMWSLHPRYRSELFFAMLPELIAKIEAGDVPDEQRGDFDLNSSMIDWSDVHRMSRRRHRLQREVRLIVDGVRNRLR